MNRMNRLKLWYHTALMNYYGKRTDSILLEEVSTDWRNIEVYDNCFNKYIIHKAKVRELKGA